MIQREHTTQRVSLRAGILSLLAGLAICATVWAAGTLWFTHKTQQLIVSMANTDIAALIAAQGLENELTMQKGYATYYFLDSDPGWLEMLEQHRRAFEQWMARARQSARGSGPHDILNRVESEYLKYLHFKDQVLDLYKSGQREEGARLHWTVRQQFESVYAFCESYKELHEQRIQEAVVDSRQKARLVSTLSWTALPVMLMVGMLLGYVLFRRVLIPIRRLAMSGEAALENGTSVIDEVKTLSQRMQSLVADVDKTHIKLQESRAHLQQTEKLALVGKLAAGVAHSIRNPLTSVKMRLFSLERSLDLDDVQKDDLEVISEEIRHLDTIIRNFLEFSRPPKLQVSRVSPSEVVDTTLSLLRHRLDSCDVAVTVRREHVLPEIIIDPDQLKEVVVNLILNACEAMPGGGKVTIVEEQGVMEPQGNVVTIRISDTGPGIPERHADEIFQPFFSTKDEGTGLGLSIAKRIMEEHGGWIHCSSGEGKGATFVLVLPVKEGMSSWHRS